MKILKNPSLSTLPYVQSCTDWTAFVFGGGIFMYNKNVNNEKCLMCNAKVRPSNKFYPDYCTLKCKIEMEGDYYVDVYETKVCRNCNKVFNWSVKNKLYCSDSCRNIYTKKSNLTFFIRDKFKCIYCGQTSLEDGIKLALDHIIPLSKGGETSYDNLITSCRRCNAIKHDCILPDDILKRLFTIVKARNMGLSESESSELAESVEYIQKIDLIRERKRRKGY